MAGTEVGETFAPNTRADPRTKANVIGDYFKQKAQAQVFPFEDTAIARRVSIPVSQINSISQGYSITLSVGYRVEQSNKFQPGEV